MVTALVATGFFIMGVALARASYDTVRAKPRIAEKPAEWDIDVEVLHVPPAGDWETAIQKQLDAIEDRSPDNELTSATSVNGRLVLFYKRRKS